MLLLLTSHVYACTSPQQPSALQDSVILCGTMALQKSEVHSTQQGCKEAFSTGSNSTHQSTAATEHSKCKHIAPRCAKVQRRPAPCMLVVFLLPPGSVRVVATSSSATLTEAKNATAAAVSAAVAQACQGDVTAASQALAVAVAKASATAWSRSQAEVTVQGTGSGCAQASATATAGEGRSVF